MKTKHIKTIVVCAVFALAGIASANLITNGDFEIAGTNGYAAGWEGWAWGDSPFNEHTVKGLTDGGNDTQLLNMGNGWYMGGAGAFQTVAATAGLEYQLSVDSGAAAWWQPTGLMEMFWLDATNGVIGSVARLTVDGEAGVPNDTLQPMQTYVLSGYAPGGTESVKIEFSSRMPEGVGGAITFDNASLTVIPEPATIGLLGIAGAVMVGLRRMRIM